MSTCGGCCIEVQIYFAPMTARVQQLECSRFMRDSGRHSSNIQAIAKQEHVYVYPPLLLLRRRAPAARPLPGGMSASLRVIASSGAACLSTSPMASSTGIIGKALSLCRNRPAMVSHRLHVPLRLFSRGHGPAPYDSQARTVTTDVRTQGGEENFHPLFFDFGFGERVLGA